jgi:quercetin dioxygenase-like cupin family protein
MMRLQPQLMAIIAGVSAVLGGAAIAAQSKYAVPAPAAPAPKVEECGTESSGTRSSCNFRQSWLITRTAPSTESITRRIAEMARTHQPGQAEFKSILSEDVDWKPFPAFPPSVRLAVLVGQPSDASPYVIRVKVPAGVKLMPHRHPEDRVYTVISGVFYIGLGEQFDESKLQAYAPGSVVVLPGDTFHFHWAKSGEYVTQVTAIGPLGLEYRDAADDPRQNR